MPPGLAIGQVDPRLRAVLTDVVQPLYDRAVMRAESPYARAIGLTTAFLLAVECRLQLATAPALFDTDEAAVESLELRLPALLKAGAQKNACVGLILRLNEIQAAGQAAGEPEERHGS